MITNLLVQAPYGENMVKKGLRVFLLVLLLLIVSPGVVPVQGQFDSATCQAIIDAAVQAAIKGCGDIGRNQACYGSVRVSADYEYGATATFEQVGDRLDVSTLRTLYTAPFNPVTGEWGIAIMKLQANLPDTLPDQNAVFVMLGDAEITNMAAPQLIPCTTTAQHGMNVREGPSTNTAAGESATVTGRNAAADWLYITRDNNGRVGWIYAPLMKTSCDINVMPEVQPGTDVPAAPTNEQNTPPMQAFTFRTGDGNLFESESCAVPPSAIIVQSPRDTPVNFQANGVDVVSDSTMILQSTGLDPLLAVVLDGTSHITAQQKTVTLDPGTQGVIRLDDNHEPDRSPGIIPYVPDHFKQMAESQVLQLLPETVALPDPAVAHNVVPIKCPEDWPPLSTYEPVILASIWDGADEADVRSQSQSENRTITLDGAPLKDYDQYGFMDVAAKHRAVIEPWVDYAQYPEAWQNNPGWITYYPLGFLEPGVHTIEEQRVVFNDYTPGLPNPDGSPAVNRPPGTTLGGTCTFTVVG